MAYENFKNLHTVSDLGDINKRLLWGTIDRFQEDFHRFDDLLENQAVAEKLLFAFNLAKNGGKLANILDSRDPDEEVKQFILTFLKNLKPADDTFVDGKKTNNRTALETTAGKSDGIPPTIRERSAHIDGDRINPIK